MKKSVEFCDIIQMRCLQMKELKIYFTSDLHGYVFPTDYTDTIEKPMGILKMISAFKKDGNTLIIDGGDTIQGSPFCTFLSSEKPAIHPIATVMNAAGYDYVTLGNHEFNYGYEYLSSYLNHLNASCLCANVKDKTNQLSIQPYSIKTLENGLKIGIIGFTTDFIPVWEKPYNLTNFEVLDTFSSIKDIHDQLKSEVDVLVGVYHGGFEYDLTTHEQLSTSSENIAYKVCKELNFDILLTGHQHIPVHNQTLFGTHIIQTPHNATKYAEVHIQTKEREILDISSTLNALTTEADSQMTATLAPIEARVQEWLDHPVGHLNIPLQPSDRLDMAINGSPLANFINQIQLEVANTDLACTSFANAVKGFNQSVTVRDIVSTYVYPNTLVVREITGTVLKQALEVCASYIDYTNGELTVSKRFLQPKVAHYNYDFFSNVEYTFDLTKSVGNRVVSMIVNNQEVKPTDTYTLVMNNYRSSGVGGYEFFRDCPIVKEIQIEMTEIIIDYFKKHEYVTVDDRQFIHIIK